MIIVTDNGIERGKAYVMKMLKNYCFLAFYFQVLCDNNFMTVVFARDDLPKYVNVDHLWFSNKLFSMLKFSLKKDKAAELV